MQTSIRLGIFRSAMILLALVAMTACAAETGQTRRNEAALTGAPKPQSPIGDDEQLTRAAKDADSKLNKGKKLFAKGEDRLADGREQIKDGEKLIQKGKDEVRENRERYHSLARASGSSNSPDQVFDEAKAFKKIASNWEDGLEDIEDGNKLVSKGNKTIAKAQAEIREGRELVDAASKIKRDLEQIRQLRETDTGNGQLGVADKPIQ